MRIHAITTCVDYAPLLSRSINRWASKLQLLTVVTAPRDQLTAQLVERTPNCRLFQTTAFYDNGAYFNKGKAMQQARELLPIGEQDWHLFIDADVVPPENWLEIVIAQAPQKSILHGAKRDTENGVVVNDRELAGFFQLFHSTDPRARAPLAVNFTHAGNYDSDFMYRWPAKQQRILDLHLIHLGEPGKNWCGVGNQSVAEKIRSERQRRNWRYETVDRINRTAK